MGFAIGKYQQGMCFILDKVYESAEQYGIGILHTPWDAIAKRQVYAAGMSYAMVRDEQLIKRRLRYTMARWGYSTGYWVTEYFNEFVREKVDSFWLGVMDWQKNLAPYDHPISLTNQIHGETGPDVFLKNAYRGNCYMFEPYTQDTVPGVIGEFGESIWLGTKDPLTYDPQGHWVRQTHWNALVSNWSGALTWWTKPLYGEKGADAYDKTYPALHQFLEAENMAEEGPWDTLQVQGNVKDFEHIRALGNADSSKAFLWIIRTPPSETEDRVPLTGKKLQLSLSPNQTYTLEWWDSQQGGLLEEATLQATAEGLLEIPVYDKIGRDAAAKVMASDQIRLRKK